MTPLLVHLDGPAAYEVGRVLRAGCPGAEPVAGASSEPWWGEVREFDAPAVKIAGLARAAIMVTADLRIVDFDDALLIKQVTNGICTEAGGEEWLADRTLCEPTDYCNDEHHFTRRWGCQRCNFRLPLPDRIAVVGKSALLVARVNQWGGQRWRCDHIAHECRIICGTMSVCAGSWLDAVHAMIRYCTNDRRPVA